ncbi:MAG TPA: HAD family hydrolase [Nocardioides sp.]|nr:HAD family hydrolase [Nocardioides sp.]
MALHLQLPVVVLDLDGTLVDSVYEHVCAWQRAFHRVGRHVSGMRIHEAIGMGGDRLVAHVAGDAAESAVGDDVRALHDTYFMEALRTVSALDGASELIEALTDQGRKVVVASSSPPEVVDELVALLDAHAKLCAVVTIADVGASKPAPDLVTTAVERAGGEPGIAVGDATWDVLAAEAAGMPCIGLRSGGIAAERLRSAGAPWVYDGPRDLLSRLPESPLRER